MASVNFEKLKLPQQVKAMLYHCDAEKRKETNHSNIDIDKSATPSNTQGELDYYAACRRYDDRIAYLDAKPGANRRKDRVTCFGLNISSPKDLKTEDEQEFFDRVVDLIADQYGADNIVQYYLHVDERHKYINSETSEMCMSRTHLHCYVVPEHKGKLNGKWFSNRSNMVKLNNAIHKMAQEQFGVMFMDGSKRKSRKTVEQLKNESTYLEVQKELDKQRDALDARQTAVCSREVAVNIKEADLSRREDDSKAELQKAVEVRDMAFRVLMQLQQLEEEDKELIELGKKQRHSQRVSGLDADTVIKSYHELDTRIDSITPQA